jgi:hypothetical protein
MVNYNETLAAFHAEVERLMAESQQLDEKIKKFLKVIEIVQTLAAESNEPLIEPPPMHPDEEKGFTDRVREILKANSSKRLTAIEIRDVLLKSSPKDDPKIVLIHTHNTLKRLHRQDEVEETRINDGRNAYQWKEASYAEVLGSLSAIEDLAAAGEQAKPRKTIGQRLAEYGTQKTGMPLPPDPIEKVMEDMSRKKAEEIRKKSPFAK